MAKLVEQVSARKVLEITLTLTGEEAGALLTVLRNVGGHPQNTARGLTDKVLRVLEETAVEPVGARQGLSNFYFE